MRGLRPPAPIFLHGTPVDRPLRAHMRSTTLCCRHNGAVSTQHDEYIMLPGALARHVMRRGRHEHDGVALDQELLEMARHFVTSPDALHCLPPLSPRLDGVIWAELPNTGREGGGVNRELDKKGKEVA